MQISRRLSYFSTVSNVGRLIFCVRMGTGVALPLWPPYSFKLTDCDHVDHITYQISPGQSETDEARILVNAD